jgi:hypothetical protein
MNLIKRKFRPISLLMLLFFITTIFGCKKNDNNSEPLQVSDYFPSWAAISPTNSITHSYNSSLSEIENGAALADAMQSLQPGDELKIESGTYSINSYFDLKVSGTESAPIWIIAEDGVVITRPDANQNLLNIGASGPVSYLCTRGIEFTGGSAGVRFYNCSNIWLDQCHIHHTQEAGLTTNTENTSFMYITQNEIDNTGGTGEGMYLGANYGAVIMSQSVIALNHVHHTNGAGVTQGDGIELKQGSWGNLIADNLVHDCNYPCILVYGTDGKQQNIIEKNICYNSGDNTMQVQGEAIVRNNLIMSGNGSAFSSSNHQGTTTNLQVIHNTIINSGRATNLSSWDSRENMVLANNVIYSQNAESIRFPGGAANVVVEGNVVAGNVFGVSEGYTETSNTANPLADFTDVLWNATTRNALPVEGSVIIDAGSSNYAVDDDITGEKRSGTLESGCYDRK